MARKKNSQITLDDLIKLGPKKLIIIFIAAVLIYFGDFSFWNVDEGGNTNTNTYGDSSSGIVAGTVKRVIDGDTAVIVVGNEERRVRFLGVDTPETVHPNKPAQFYGKEASNFTKSSLTGKRVWLEYDSNPTDRYNRHLAYIWTAKPGNINESTIRRDMFNARLLLDGYAKVMIIKPNKRYADIFTKFQDEAKNSRKGLWQQ